MAASAGTELDGVCDRIEAAIATAQASARTTMLVGHSQGGFLAHRVLAKNGTRKNADTVLIGVGSGLKPITLLSRFNDGEFQRALWMSTIGMILMESVVVVQALRVLPDLFAHVLGPLYAAAVPFAVPFAYVPPVTPQQFSGHVNELTQAAFDAVLHFVHLRPLGFAALGLGLLVTLLANRRWNRLRPPPMNLAIKPKVQEWIEYSTYHDIVGRMLVPELPPDARSISLPVSSHPLLDHVGYFGASSPLPRRLAERCLFQTGILSHSLPEGFEDRALAIAGRWRSLRILSTAAICVYVFIGLGATHVPMMRAYQYALTVFAFLALALGTIGSYVERFRLARTLRAAEAAQIVGVDAPLPVGPVPPRVRALPAAVLWSVALGSFVLGGVSGAIYGWSSEAALLWARSFTICLGFASLVTVGYRPLKRVLLPLYVLLVTLPLIGSQPVAATVDQAIPRWALIPGLPAGLLALLSVVFSAYLLRLSRVGPRRIVQGHRLERATHFQGAARSPSSRRGR